MFKSVSSGVKLFPERTSSKLNVDYFARGEEDTLGSINQRRPEKSRSLRLSFLRIDWHDAIYLPNCYASVRPAYKIPPPPFIPLLFSPWLNYDHVRKFKWIIDETDSITRPSHAPQPRKHESLKF